jgi:hypothetical protein
MCGSFFSNWVDFFSLITSFATCAISLHDIIFRQQRTSVPPRVSLSILKKETSPHYAIEHCLFSAFSRTIEGIASNRSISPPLCLAFNTKMLPLSIVLSRGPASCASESKQEESREGCSPCGCDPDFRNGEGTREGCSPRWRRNKGLNLTFSMTSNP